MYDLVVVVRKFGETFESISSKSRVWPSSKQLEKANRKRNTRDAQPLSKFRPTAEAYLTGTAST